MSRFEDTTLKVATFTPGTGFKDHNCAKCDIKPIAAAVFANGLFVEANILLLGRQFPYKLAVYCVNHIPKCLDDLDSPATR